MSVDYTLRPREGSVSACVHIHVWVHVSACVGLVRLDEGKRKGTEGSSFHRSGLRYRHLKEVRGNSRAQTSFPQGSIPLRFNRG